MFPALAYTHSYIVLISLTVTQLVDFYPELFVLLQCTLINMDCTFKEHNNFIKCNIQHMN